MTTQTNTTLSNATHIITCVVTSDKRGVYDYINANGDINAATEKGVTALHYAAKLGKTEIVKSLLANGANIYATDNNGKTPLIWAAEKSQTKIVNLIKKYLAKNS